MSQGNSGGRYIQNEIAFANHMETKAKIVDTEQLFIGVDFAVFVFRYPYQALQALQSFKRSNEYYDYAILSRDTRVMIHNVHYKADE